MQRNSIELSPKSIPRQLQQNSSDTPYSEPSSSQFYSESSTAASSRSIMSSYANDLCPFCSPSSQSSLHASPSQVCNAPLTYNMLGEAQSESGERQILETDNETRKDDILSRIWSPCSGGCSIGEQLDCFDFPISYRDLVYRWIALDRPNLENLRVPLGMQMMPIYQQSNFGFSPETNVAMTDLQQICEAQEQNIIETITEYFDSRSRTKVNSFLHFASHLDVYSAINAELVCLEDRLPKDSNNISRLYEDIWWNTIQAFEFDRSICTARTPHNCFGYLLWGEVLSLPLGDIIDKFQIYKNRSSVIKPVLLKQFKEKMSTMMNSLSTSCLSTEPKARDQTILSPSLSTHMSTLGISEFVTETNTDPFGTPASLEGFTTFWPKDNSSPSAQTNPTPARSPLQNSPLEENLSVTFTEQQAQLEGTKPLKSDIQWNDTSSFQDIYRLPPFDLLPTLHDSTQGDSSINTSFLGTTDHSKSLRPLSYSALDFKYHHDEVTGTNGISSTPVTPSTGSFSMHSTSRSRKRQGSNFSKQEEDIKDFIETTNGSANIRKALHDLSRFTIKDSQQLFDVMSTRRDSTSSIGSSFDNQNALKKVEEYKNLLDQAASQLGTAARLLSVQAEKLQPSKGIEDKLYLPTRSTDSSPPATYRSSTTSKRARYTVPGTPESNFSLRIQTTS